MINSSFIVFFLRAGKYSSKYQKYEKITLICYCNLWRVLKNWKIIKKSSNSALMLLYRNDYERKLIFLTATWLSYGWL